jgi:hypothetical protein
MSTFSWHMHVTLIHAPMAAYSSPSADPKQRTALMQLSSRLQSCWQKDLKWDLIPEAIGKVLVFV